MAGCKGCKGCSAPSSGGEPWSDEDLWDEETERDPIEDEEEEE